MKLALNTLVYEAAGVKAEECVRSISRLGFRYVQWAACRQGDPSAMAKAVRRDLAAMFDDNGLYCAQMLMTDVQHLAASDGRKGKDALDYMKRAASFQLELGGRQVLIGWGCGVLEAGVMPEQSWLRMVEALREFAEWGLHRGILIGLELEPQVYLLVNTTARMAKAVQDVGMPNLFCNVDVGRLAFAREPPACLEKLRGRILQMHLSETGAYLHTKGILGTGIADFKAYVDKARELGIEENCTRYSEPCVAGIELGGPGERIDDPERWIRESLAHLARVLPDVEK